MLKFLYRISTGGAISSSPLNIDTSFDIYDEEEEEEDDEEEYDVTDFHCCGFCCGGCGGGSDFLIGV